MQILMEPFASLDGYLAWVEQRPEEEHYEVVDGFAVMSPSPSMRHQGALSRLLVALAHAAPNGFEVLPAPVDWLLWEAPRLQIREPDLLVVAREDARGPLLARPPLLAVEILSPTSFERDAVAKRREYAKAGLDHYWIVDPDLPQIAVYRRSGETLGLATHATGDTELVVGEPFSIRLRPSDLVV